MTGRITPRPSTGGGLELTAYNTTGRTPNGTYEAELDLGADGRYRLIKLTLVATDRTRGLASADQYHPSIPMLIGQADEASRLTSESLEEAIQIEGRPDGSDSWYSDFAGAFRFARANSKAPATLLAEANGVPVTAVHRWTREARRRGFLPPDVRSRSRR